MTYIKDVVCCPEQHLALLIALAVLAPGVAFVIHDATEDGWRETRLLKSFASFYANILFWVIGMWRAVIVAIVGAVLSVTVVYLLLAARDRWCKEGGKCSTTSSTETRPRPRQASRAWRPEPCEWALDRQEWRACLEEESLR